MVVAVDFDGTLVHDDKWPSIGKPVYDAFRVLRKFKSNGGELILWTCRSGESLEPAVSFCASHGVEVDAINEPTEDQIKNWKGPLGRKVFADLYIDDRAISSPGGLDWKYIDSLLNQ